MVVVSSSILLGRDRCDGRNRVAAKSVAVVVREEQTGGDGGESMVVDVCAVSDLETAALRIAFLLTGSEEEDEDP